MTTSQPSSHRISKDAIHIWRLSNILENIAAFAVLVALIWASHYFQWYTWISITLCVLFILNLLYAVWEIIFEPIYLRNSWRFFIDESFVHIEKGIFIKKQTTIPMTKIQFVELKQGPLFRRYDLYTISIQTVRSIHAIPAIKGNDANQLRDEIAIYAKVEED